MIGQHVQRAKEQQARSARLRASKPAALKGFSLFLRDQQRRVRQAVGLYADPSQEGTIDQRDIPLLLRPATVHLPTRHKWPHPPESTIFEYRR